MTNQLPPIPDDDSHWDETVQNQPQRRAPNRQPPPTQGQPPVQRPPRQGTHNVQRVSRQRQQRRAQKENLLYFPLWSLGLMLLVVLVVAFAIVFGIVALGGNQAPTDAEPELRVITAVATSTPFIPDPNEVVLATPTIPADLSSVILPAQTPDNLALDGPALPTVAFTNTPMPLSVGVRVIVANVGDQELNVRNIAGVTSSEILFRSPEGTEFSIVDGPQQADGFTWWRIQDPITQNSGWAVANYLQVLDAGTGQ